MLGTGMDGPWTPLPTKAEAWASLQGGGGGGLAGTLGRSGTVGLGVVFCFLMYVW